jgi:twitching motility protein PilT|tara:strand:- start:198 stop:392 length:195 start_codon:yes stop_codon:yes gene_type:complete
MREDPDVIMIGEMRDAETVQAALELAETGHLVISTLHTSSAVQTISRLLSFFPTESQNAVREKL